MYSFQASVAHLPHPVIAYSWGRSGAELGVAYPVLNYGSPYIQDFAAIVNHKKAPGFSAHEKFGGCLLAGQRSG
jgi:hypothetical protein